MFNVIRSLSLNNVHLVSLAREGKISFTKHKSSLILLNEKKQLSLETAESLLQAYYLLLAPLNVRFT